MRKPSTQPSLATRIISISIYVTPILVTEHNGVLVVRVLCACLCVGGSVLELNVLGSLSNEYLEGLAHLLVKWRE